MKNVLIIGENSYIGKSFANYANNQFSIKSISARGNQWKEVDFTGFDSILHCAGIAHIKQKKSIKELYYSINRDLALEVAIKAKESGVKQFIFLSTMSVYGKGDTEITLKTIPKPQGFYGDSKLQAEVAIQSLSDTDFVVCIIRPPMVYGYDCPGNFSRLVQLAKKLPVFPKINNRRSMIYIDNLCAFISCAISNNHNGIHLPQNKDCVNTTELVCTIAKLHNKKIRTTRIFNPLISLSSKFFSPVRKLFGNLTYAHNEQSVVCGETDFVDSIKISLFGNNEIRITVITSYYLPEVTTVSTLYENIVHDLAECGAFVTLVCGIPTRGVDTQTTKKYSQNPIEQVSGQLRIIRVGPKKGEGTNFIFRSIYHLYRSYCIYRKARKVGTDVYFVYSTPPYMGFFGALLSKRAKVIYDLQDIFPDTLISSGKAREGSASIKILRRLESLVYKKCNHLRVLSSDMANTLKARGVSEEKISVINNWVDENKVTYINRQNNPLFDDFRIPRDKFYVCYAGNIGLLQNLSTMIYAAELLQSSHSQIEFVIIGDGAWKPEILKLIESKRLTNVRVFPMQNPDMIPYVYNLGNIGVVTIAKGVSKSSMPSKTWSILSVSRPVICEVDEDSELHNIMADNQCGICITPNDYEGFANAVLDLYNNPKKLEEYGNNGRKFVEVNISRKILTKKIFDCALEVYKQG